MKKILLVMALVVFAVGAVFAQNPPNVVCDGMHAPMPCMPMPGPQMYLYTITAQNPGELIMDVMVGTDDMNVANYAGWVLPPGWNAMVMPGPQFLHDGYTIKGFVSPGPTGMCQGFVQFMGPGMPSVTVGYDHPWPAHDVGWMVNGMYMESWAAPVGSGAPVGLPSGPLHGPSDKDYEPNDPIDPPAEYIDVTQG